MVVGVVGLGFGVGVPPVVGAGAGPTPRLASIRTVARTERGCTRTPMGGSSVTSTVVVPESPDMSIISVSIFEMRANRDELPVIETWGGSNT